MATASAETALGRGYEALASGDWEGARAAFQEALDGTDSPEALDGLGRALRWLRDKRGAIVIVSAHTRASAETASCRLRLGQDRCLICRDFLEAL